MSAQGTNLKELISILKKDSQLIQFHKDQFTNKIDYVNETEPYKHEIQYPSKEEAQCFVNKISERMNCFLTKGKSVTENLVSASEKLNMAQEKQIEDQREIVTNNAIKIGELTSYLEQLNEKGYELEVLEEAKQKLVNQQNSKRESLSSLRNQQQNTESQINGFNRQIEQTLSKVQNLEKQKNILRNEKKLLQTQVTESIKRMKELITLIEKNKKQAQYYALKFEEKRKEVEKQKSTQKEKSNKCASLKVQLEKDLEKSRDFFPVFFTVGIYSHVMQSKIKSSMKEIEDTLEEIREISNQMDKCGSEIDEININICNLQIYLKEFTDELNSINIKSPNLNKQIQKIDEDIKLIDNKIVQLKGQIPNFHSLLEQSKMATYQLQVKQKMFSDEINTIKYDENMKDAQIHIKQIESEKLMVKIDKEKDILEKSQEDTKIKPIVEQIKNLQKNIIKHRNELNDIISGFGSNQQSANFIEKFLDKKQLSHKNANKKIVQLADHAGISEKRFEDFGENLRQLFE